MNFDAKIQKFCQKGEKYPPNVEKNEKYLFILKKMSNFARFLVKTRHNNLIMKRKFRLWMLVAILTFGGVAPMLTSCEKDDEEIVRRKEYFTYWNQCEALTALKEGRCYQPEISQLHQRGRPYCHLRHGRNLRR